jgi:hypothetical protein
LAEIVTNSTKSDKSIMNFDQKLVGFSQE